MVNNISEASNNQHIDTKNNSTPTQSLDASDKLLPHMQFFTSAVENQDWNKDFNNMSREWDHVQKNTGQTIQQDTNDIPDYRISDKLRKGAFDDMKQFAKDNPDFSEWFQKNLKEAEETADSALQTQPDMSTDEKVNFREDLIERSMLQRTCFLHFTIVIPSDKYPSLAKAKGLNDWQTQDLMRQIDGPTQY